MYGAWGRNRTADTGIFSPLLLPAELPRRMRTKQACSTTPLELNYLSNEVLQLISASPDAYRIERFLLPTVKLKLS